MRNPRNLLQIEFARLADEQFVEAAIFAQDEGIVEIGNEQDILHAKRHEPVETFKRIFGIEKRAGFRRRYEITGARQIRHGASVRIVTSGGRLVR